MKVTVITVISSKVIKSFWFRLKICRYDYKDYKIERDKWDKWETLATAGFLASPPHNMLVGKMGQKYFLYFN